jgi:hypothetical protein
VTIHSEIKALGLNSNGLGMLVMSKFGVLWLVDLIDGETIKVLTVHGYGNSGVKTDAEIWCQNNNITKAVVL